MLPRGFSFSLVFFRDLRGAKAASAPPARSPFYGNITTRFRSPDAPKNKWKNDGMTGKNKFPKQPKKQAPALLVKLRRSAGNCPGPIPFGLLTSHTAPCPPFHDLPHPIRVGEHLYKEILILFIASSGHVWKVLLKKQHEGLAVVVLGIAVPLVLSGIVVFHLEQHLIHLGEVSGVLHIHLINNNRKLQ